MAVGAMPTYCYFDLWEDEAAIKEKVRAVAGAIGRQNEGEEAIASYEDRAGEFQARFADSDFAGLLAGVVRFVSGASSAFAPATSSTPC